MKPTTDSARAFVSYAKTAAYAAAVLAALFVLVAAPERESIAAETTSRSLDRGVARVESGTTDIDVSASDYTSYVTLLTIEPDDNNAMHDVTIVLDLDGGDDGESWANAATTETATFAIARKIEGNWRIDDELETTAVSGDNADLRSVTLQPGIIGPVEDCRVYVELSAEATDIRIPYLVIYKSGATATFTDVTAG